MYQRRIVSILRQKKQGVQCALEEPIDFGAGGRFNSFFLLILLLLLLHSCSFSLSSRSRFFLNVKRFLERRSLVSSFASFSLLFCLASIPFPLFWICSCLAWACLSCTTGSLPFTFFLFTDSPFFSSYHIDMYSTATKTKINIERQLAKIGTKSHLMRHFFLCNFLSFSLHNK